MKKHIKIYRFEHPENGRGIFRNNLANSGVCDNIDERHADFNVPEMDGVDLYKDDLEWFCAYKSKEDVKAWIKLEEFKHLLKLGFQLKELVVTNYQEGFHQVIFTKDSIQNTKYITQYSTL